jgi:hypothetical protein
MRARRLRLETEYHQWNRSSGVRATARARQNHKQDRRRAAEAAINRRKCLLRSHENELFARTQLLLGVGESRFEHFANRLPRAAVALN